MKQVIPRNARGMTLIEVLFSVFLLSVGTLGLLQGLYLSKKSSDDGQKKLALFALARGYLDQLRSLKPVELEASSFNLYHTDGTSSAFVEDVWTDIPTSAMALVAPGVRMQIKPSVTLQDTSTGDWYQIQLSYRYAWARGLSTNVAQWPIFNLQALISKLDNSALIALSPATEIFLQSNQQPERWPPQWASYDPKIYGNTLPMPPVPPPVPWRPTPPPPGAWTPGPPVSSPPQNQNTSSSL